MRMSLGRRIEAGITGDAGIKNAEEIRRRPGIKAHSGIAEKAGIARSLLPKNPNLFALPWPRSPAVAALLENKPHATNARRIGGVPLRTAPAATQTPYAMPLRPAAPQMTYAMPLRTTPAQRGLRLHRPTGRFNSTPGGGDENGLARVNASFPGQDPLHRLSGRSKLARLVDSNRPSNLHKASVLDNVLVQKQMAKLLCAEGHGLCGLQRHANAGSLDRVDARLPASQPLPGQECQQRCEHRP